MFIPRVMKFLNRHALKKRTIIYHLIIFLFYIKFIENSFIENNNKIKSHVCDLIEAEKTYFESIFRYDIVLVVNRIKDDHLNQMFDFKKKLWQHIPFFKNITKFTRAHLFHENYIGEDGTLKRHAAIRILFEEVKRDLLQSMDLLCNRIANIVKNCKIFNFVTYWLSDEIFLYLKDRKFVQKEFFNEEDKINFFNQNKEKVFFFIDSDSPTSYPYADKKIIHETPFEGYFYPEKINILNSILECVSKNIKESQTTLCKKSAFYLLRKQIKRHYASLGIFINLHFRNINLIFYDIVLKPLTYDKSAVYMSFFLKESDPFVISLFSQLNMNFKVHASILKHGVCKIKWSTAYIDSILRIFYRYAIFKETVNIGLYPELITLLFPVPFFLDRFQGYNKAYGFIRTVIDFSQLKTFSKYDKFFHDHNVVKIRAITDNYMSTLTIK